MDRQLSRFHLKGRSVRGFAQLTSYDLLEICTQIEIIENGWRCRQPEDEIIHSIELITALLAHAGLPRCSHTA
jgi:hypothetical protein